MQAAPLTKTSTVAEVDGFIDLLRAACDNPTMNTALEKLLSQPDEQRQSMVHNWVSDLLLRDAPRDFTRAIACLMDDGVAEKAYAVIYHCQRKTFFRL